MSFLLFRSLGEATSFCECSPGLQSSASPPKDGDLAAGDRAQESNLELSGLIALLNLMTEQENKTPLVALSSASRPGPLHALLDPQAAFQRCLATPSLSHFLPLLHYPFNVLALLFLQSEPRLMEK